LIKNIVPEKGIGLRRQKNVLDPPTPLERMRGGAAPPHDSEVETLVSKTRPLFTLLAAGALAVTTAGGARAASGWQPDPVPIASGNILALARIAPHTTWAAGFQLTSTGGKGSRLNPVVLSRDDRDGRGWQRVATPGDGLASRANALGAHGADDVWVVGDNDPGRSGAFGSPVFTEHWDGRAWQTVPVPTASDVLSAGLFGVSVLNPHDAWAVGSEQILRGGVSSLDSIIEHWDGTAWQPVKLPVDAGATYLTSITANGPHDVWAVGSLDRKPLVLHFDGKAWTPVADLPAVADGGEFNTVVATGPHDVWAAGDAGWASGPLVEHFDGRSWTAVPAPGTGEIFSATATPGGVAFVGYTRRTGVAYGQAYDGRSWTDLGIPAMGEFNSPYAVAAGDGKLTVSGAYGTADGVMHPLMIGTAVR
jgi:hypothetical protein